MRPRHAPHNSAITTPKGTGRTPRVLAAIGLVAMLVTLLRPSPASALAIAPSNDNFVSATTINILPLSEAVNINEATIENSEPFGCAFSNQTIWYKLTPATDSWLSCNTVGASFPFGGSLTVYRDTGGGIFGLSYVACAYNTNNAVFLAQAGTRYYFQAGAPCCGNFGNLQVSIAAVPPPVPIVNFYFYPSDPSSFDVVQFNDNSSDPGQIGFKSYTWDFGNGVVQAPDSGYYAYHRFPSDGDYTVVHTATTYDGRTGSASRVVSVKTHDVTIARFQVPQSAAMGQTRQLSVGISNTRYPEVVQVALTKGIPGPFQQFQQVGVLQMFVPVRGGNRTTDFNFSYTFTADDAAIGKVTFRAEATIVNGRDALAADNDVTALPTKVGKSISEILSDRPDADEGPSRLALLGVAPTTSGSRDLTVRLALPRSESAQLQVLDVTGRVVARRDLSSLGAGTHETNVSWESRPAAGIYWVRLTQGGAFVSTKVALLQ